MYIMEHNLFRFPSQSRCTPLLLILFNILKSTRPFDLLPPNRLSMPTNRINDVNSTCSADSFSVSVIMEKPFKGVIFSKDFSQECRSQGVLNQMVTLNMPTSGCGVRLTSDRDEERTQDDELPDDPDSDLFYYTVTLVVQMDKYLRQITDQERVIKCYLNSDDTKLRSEAMKKAVIDDLKKDGRTARMKSDWIDSNPETNEAEMQALNHARAWMEITGEEDTDENLGDPGIVQVGETMVLTIKSTLPVNIGWRVIDCFAHDGIGDSSQRLLDENGCPIDELILPALKLSKPRMIGSSTNTVSKLVTKRHPPNKAEKMRSRRAIVKKTGEELKRFDSHDDETKKKSGYMRYQEAFASFPAFKFPDRDRLHLSCGLQLCRGECQKVDCNALLRSSRNMGQHPNQKVILLNNKFPHKNTPVDDDDIIDRLQVFNSVEVIAPGIELDDYRGRFRPGETTLIRKPKVTTLSGDRTFCMSTNKMALAFCVLGVIFIIAVLVALGALIRARRSGHVHYSRSIFSSSGTSGSACGGSRLLLQESPCLSTGRVRWPY